MCATLYMQDNMKLQILSSSCQDVIPIIPNLYDFDRIFFILKSVGSSVILESIDLHFGQSSIHIL